MRDPDALRWNLIMPVKRLERAKTRLGGLTDERRRRLALSFALDAADAALASARVRRLLVVTADPDAASELRRRGAVIVEETWCAGLNAAIEQGAAAVRQDDPMGRTAVITGDLPAASSAEIDAALASAESHRRAVLADSDSTGTVFLTANPFTTNSPTVNPITSDPLVANPRAVPEAPSRVRLRPLFGPDSYARHVNAGHIALRGDFPGLQRDVDTREDLEAACSLGVGAMTTAALSEPGAALLRG